jgi:hypothetical protein
MALKIDFSIMYTTPPYSKLKDGLKQIAQLCLIKKRMVNIRYKHNICLPIPLIYGHSYVKSNASSELISDKETVNVTVVSTIG